MVSINGHSKETLLCQFILCQFVDQLYKVELTFEFQSSYQIIPITINNAVCSDRKHFPQKKLSSYTFCCNKFLRMDHLHKPTNVLHYFLNYWRPQLISLSKHKNLLRHMMRRFLGFDSSENIIRCPKINGLPIEQLYHVSI